MKGNTLSNNDKAHEAKNNFSFIKEDIALPITNDIWLADSECMFYIACD